MGLSGIMGLLHGGEEAEQSCSLVSVLFPEFPHETSFEFRVSWLRRV